MRAVISEPDCSAASTTSVPCDKPAMMRLRCGKFAASGGVPNGYSLSEEAVVRNAMGQFAVLARIDPVQPGADDRQRAAFALQAALMGRRIDA